MLAKIGGDSMSPVLLDGQYAVIGPQYLNTATPRDREIVVVKVVVNKDADPQIDEEWEGFYCKRVQEREGMCYFTSINQSGASFSIDRRNCRLWPVIGVLFAGHGIPPED